VDIKDTLKNFFKDENGKPNKKNISIFTTALIILILLLKAMSTNVSENANVNVDYGLPQPEEEGPVRIGRNVDISYITKGEFDYLLAKSLEDYAEIQSQSFAVALKTLQENILNEVLGLNKSQLQNFESNIQKKFLNLEAELKDLQYKNQQYEKLFKEWSQYPVTHSGSEQFGAVRQTRPDIPINTYSSANSSYYSEQYSVQTADRNFSYYDPNIPLRGESGFIINSFKNISSDGYVLNAGDIYNPGFLNTDGITAGQLFSGILITGAVSSKTRCPVVVELTQDVIINDQIIVPKYSRLTGYAIADFNTRQIYFDIDRLILTHREITIKASLVNYDGTPGFCSKYIDKTNEAFWKTFSLNFVSALLQSYKDITYFISDRGVPVKSYDDTTMNKAIDATSSGLLDFANRLMADAQAMGAIILVDPNVKVKILIEENIPLEKLI